LPFPFRKGSKATLEGAAREQGRAAREQGGRTGGAAGQCSGAARVLVLVGS